MSSFIINILKLLEAVITGIKDDPEFRVLLVLLVTMLIGYGVLVPTTDISKVFTIIFTFLSVGVFVTLNTKIILMTLRQEKEKLLKCKNMKKR